MSELLDTFPAACLERLAVADGDCSSSYAQLDAAANSLARRLRDLGVKPGVLVAICHDRSVAAVAGALAVLRAGGGYVGLDPAHPDARLTYLCSDAGATVLLAHASVVERLGSLPCTVLDLDAELAAAAPTSGPPEPMGGPADIAYVIYTSGSTGEPKGVQVSRANLRALIDWHVQAFSITPDDRASVVASPAFDASVWETWPHLAAGASLHIPDHATTVTPAALQQWMADQEITIAFVPTPMAELLLELQWPADTSLRIMLTGGDVLHRRPAPGTPFTLVNNYGVTEATVVSTSGVVAPEGAGLPSIGRSIAGTVLRILGADGRVVPDGEQGELYISGRSVATGYLNRPELTASRFVADPFSDEPGARMYRTGDLARITDDGSVQFLGRIDDGQVQVRGHRIELDEIAAVLAGHPSVSQCAVMLRDDGGDARLVAYVVPADVPMPGREQLRAHLAERLPAQMVPGAFVEIAALPVTSNGKLDRAALPAPGWEVLVSDSAAPDGPTEAAIAAILEELIELEGIGRDDNFFELGGHSLMGAQVVARIQERFGVELPLLAVFDNPSVAEMAIVVGEAVVARVESMSDEEAERMLASSAGE
jgi:amino acid adenylation domain-containing protein